MVRSFGLGCVVGCVSEPHYRIGLRPFLTLDDIELNIIALFQGFVPVQLNCGVVNEYVWPVFTPDESVALGIVEPLDFSFVLSHRLPPSLHRLEVKAHKWTTGDLRAASSMTMQGGERLIPNRGRASTKWDESQRGPGTAPSGWDRRKFIFYVSSRPRRHSRGRRKGFFRP